MNKIVVFDVETPNSNNDRICSIGVTIIEDGIVKESENYLVNPECDFEYRNINIHGIKPDDIKNAPTFPTVWALIGENFMNNMVVAHNASFDLGVLKKTLLYYEINDLVLMYADTLRIARAILKETANHKLPTLCWYYDIELKHHDSGSDSWACAQLLLNLVEDGADLNKYIKEYRLGI
ncbi:MAG: 3'-5' exonuclease [Firmicutes bacterium]|nr:3'-5' exonuclease [Bacillota bacterium]